MSRAAFMVAAVAAALMLGLAYAALTNLRFMP